MNRSSCSGDTSATAIALIAGAGDDDGRRSQLLRAKQRLRVWCGRSKIHWVNFSGCASQAIRATIGCAALGVCLLALNSQPAFSKGNNIVAVYPADGDKAVAVASTKAESLSAEL